MLRKLFYLEPGELGRLLPFFFLYVILFVALTLADGLSISLFAQRVGADRLPSWYAFTACISLVAIGFYIRFVMGTGSARMFYFILLGSGGLYLLCWVGLQLGTANATWFGLLFVGREVTLTLVMMHFGTFLQDFFTRVEMNRVMPIVYAGGRLGGIFGGALLTLLAGPLGLIHLALLYVVLVVIGISMVTWIVRVRPPVESVADTFSDAGVRGPVTGGNPSQLEAEALQSLGGFLRFVWASPLLYWLTVTTILFMACRWVLNYQYNSFFEQHFEDDVAMARFLGQYTQIALLLSLVLQLVVVSRLIAWLGIKGAHALYAGLLLSGTMLNLLPMTFFSAVFSRLLEVELRFGLRNPVNQLMNNKFSKSLRIRVRAWSLGLLIPLSTLLVSSLLWTLTRTGHPGVIAWVGGGLGLAYVLTSRGLFSSFQESEPPLWSKLRTTVCKIPPFR